MRKHWRYAVYIYRHKLFVYRAGRTLGLWPWQLLRHDLSKLKPDEWVPYAENFYGGPHRPWSEVNGYEKTHYFDAAWARSREGVSAAFDAAWLRHQHRNPHHWQHWCLREDDGELKVVAMPDRYRREMVADWMGAGMAIKGHGLERALPETRAWWERNRDKILLHPDTRAWVERQLGPAR